MSGGLLTETRKPIQLKTDPFAVGPKPYLASLWLDLGLLVGVMVPLWLVIVWVGVPSGSIMAGLGLLGAVAVVFRLYQTWAEIRSAKRLLRWGTHIHVVFAPQAMAIESAEGTVFAAAYSDLKGARRTGFGLILALPGKRRIAIPRDAFPVPGTYELVERYLREFLREPIQSGPT